MGADDKTVVAQEQSEFADAFASLAEGLREPGEKTAEEKAAAEKATADKAAADAAAAEKATADKAAADTAAAEKATADKAAADAAAAEKATADKAAADAAAAPKPSAGEEAARAELAEAQRKLKELEDAKPAAKTAEQLAAEEAAKKPLYTAEETTFLEEYHKNWETVAKGEELKRKGEYRSLVQHVFEQMQARYDPVLQYMQDLAPKTHFGEIVRLVPDYLAVREGAVEWAGKQVGFLKDAYARVISDGSPQDVADMIQTYKTATNYKPPVVAAAKPAAAAAGGAVAAEDDAAKAAAAAALRTVESQRTTPADPADPSDFAGAFAEFSSSSR